MTQRQVVSMTQSQTAIKRRAGFTLSEVMITLCLTAMMCVSIFAGLQNISRLTMAVSSRSEAKRLMQAEAERLISVEFGSFAASADQLITSCFRTSYVPGSEAQFAYPASGTTGRVIFTRRVVAVDATSTTKTLRVEVQWMSQGRTNTVSTPVFRAQ